MAQDIHEVLQRVFGHAAFRDGQEEVVQAVADGVDTLVVMPTGAGKSLCYQLPAVVRGGTTLVVSPLIALMKDQVDALTRKGIRATCINSHISPEDRRERMAGLRQGAWQLVYVAPERFTPAFMEELRRVDLRLLAIDEAHCISGWGHDFRPDYLALGKVREALGRPPTVALTATATPIVQKDIVQVLALPRCRRFVRGFDRKNIGLHVVMCGSAEEKDRRVLSLFGPGPALVYCSTRKNVERVVRILRDAQVEAGFYHGGLEPAARVMAQEAFMTGRVPVVVATNAFGMGVDKSDIRCILHYDIPGTVEAYYQEIGRAGRDGLPSRAILLFRREDRGIQEFFIRQSHPPLDCLLALDARLQALWHANQTKAALHGSPEGLDEPVCCVFPRLDDLTAAMPEGSQDERMVSSCLRALQREGRLRRLPATLRPSMVGLGTKAGRPPPGLRTQVWDGIRGRVRPGCMMPISLEELGKDLDLDLPRMEAAVRALCDAGWITWRVAERTAGYEVLEPGVPIALDEKKLQARRQHELEKLDRMMAYADASCRRRYLVSYFGEKPTFERCGTCDACRGRKGSLEALPPLSLEQEQVVRRVLTCISSMKGGHSPSMVAKVLMGSQEQGVRAFRFDRLATWGALARWRLADVERLLESLVSAGALERRYTTRDVGGRERTYPVLFPSALGLGFVEGRSGELRIRFPDGMSSGVPKNRDESNVSVDLLSALRDMRTQLARADDVPAYVVAPDRTLEAIARERPLTREAMLSMHGMGPVRFARYGSRLLHAVRTWCGESS